MDTVCLKILLRVHCAVRLYDYTVPDYPLGTVGTCLMATEPRAPHALPQQNKKVKCEISFDVSSNWCSLFGPYDICYACIKGQKGEFVRIILVPFCLFE
jgi:hypothetical protein